MPPSVAHWVHAPDVLVVPDVLVPEVLVVPDVLVPDVVLAYQQDFVYP
ncbi:hypothetical protein [Trinickia sp. EG282A]